jgi:hypothetical protein
MNNTNLNSLAHEWLSKYGLVPSQEDHSDWGLNIGLSSTPLENWIARRSKIDDSDIWVNLAVHQLLGCRASLTTKDKKLQVDWRPGFVPDITSETIIHRKRTPWPEFNNPDDFIKLTKQISVILSKKIIPHAQVDAYTLKSEDLENIVSWLSPIADKVIFNLGNLYGPLPTNAICEDERKQDSGITIRFE